MRIGDIMLEWAGRGTEAAFDVHDSADGLRDDRAALVRHAIADRHNRVIDTDFGDCGPQCYPTGVGPLASVGPEVARDARTCGAAAHARHAFQCPHTAARVEQWQAAHPRVKGAKLVLLVRYLKSGVQRAPLLPPPMSDDALQDRLAQLGGVVLGGNERDDPRPRFVAFANVDELPKEVTVPVAPRAAIIPPARIGEPEIRGAAIAPTRHPHEAVAHFVQSDHYKALETEARRLGGRVVLALPASYRVPQPDPMAIMRAELDALRAEVFQLKAGRSPRTKTSPTGETVVD